MCRTSRIVHAWAETAALTVIVGERKQVRLLSGPRWVKVPNLSSIVWGRGVSGSNNFKCQMDRPISLSVEPKLSGFFNLCCFAIATGFFALLSFSGKAYGQTSTAVSVILPNDANSCARISISDIVKVSSSCPTIVIIYCIFGRNGPVWSCYNDKIDAAKPEISFPQSKQSVRQAYVGACKPTIVECIQRQKWLFAAIDGRQNPYLGVHLMKPGLGGEPLDPTILQARRKQSRG